MEATGETEYGGAETKEVQIEVNEEKVAMVSTELETENIRETEIENATEVGTEKSEKMEREVKKNEIFHTFFRTGSRAVKPHVGPEIELLKYAVKTYRFIRDTWFDDFEDEYELKTGSILTEKVNLILAGPLYTLVLHGVSRTLLTTRSRRVMCSMRGF